MGAGRAYPASNRRYESASATQSCPLRWPRLCAWPVRGRPQLTHICNDVSAVLEGPVNRTGTRTPQMRPLGTSHRTARKTATTRTCLHCCEQAESTMSR